ncbi:hypothetical protein [Nitrosopumilus sp.]|uniref:hypothetical protein n=1 Tax=Nitrosopumilus sp. TaxID=2024843 RepID=UPI003D0C6195
MTDLTALTPIGTPALEDNIYVVDDPSSTKLPRKATLQQIKDLFKAVAETLTNKSISLTNNTITGTPAEFDTALQGDTFVYTSDGVVISGGALGTPSSGTLTNCTGLPAAGVTNTAMTLSDTQTATNKTLTAPVITYTLNAQTGTTYTPDINDAKKVITCDNAAAITVTIPPNSSVAYGTGSQINIIQKGAGQVTISEGSGVTINSTGGTSDAPKLRSQYSSATAIKIATDEWIIVGDIE